MQTFDKAATCYSLTFAPSGYDTDGTNCKYELNAW